MTIQQLDRPLSQVDEAAERVQASTPDAWSRSTEEPLMSDMRRATETVRRLAQDRVVRLAAAIAVAALVIVVATLWGRRRPPRTIENVLVERSREAFDLARENLEAMASKLAWIER